MMRMTAAATAALTLMTGAGRANAAGFPLVVRVADGAGISAPLRDAAAGEAQAILARAGFDATWVDCSDRMAQPAACTMPPGRTGVIVRLLQHGGDEPGGLVTMGYSFVNSGAGHAVLATVYVDLVQRIARKAGVDASALLGRAIAHEVGHLLLNSNSHARSGLMRATWSLSEMRRNAAPDWWFDNDESRAMRARLEASLR